MRTGIPAVDNKAGMFLGYLRVPDRIALHPGILNQLCGEMPFRPTESTAGRGQVKRLLCPSFFAQLLHPFGDCLPVVRRQPEDRAEKDAAGCLLENALPIAEAAVGLGNLVQALIGNIEKDDAFHDILQLPAVGAGIHDTAASHGPGNTAGKFQTAEPVFLRKSRQARQRNAGLGIDGAVRKQKELLQALRADEKQVLQALVREEDVRAVSQHVGGHPVLFQNGAQLCHAGHIRRKGKGPGRPADAEGRVP